MFLHMSRYDVKKYITFFLKICVKFNLISSYAFSYLSYLYLIIKSKNDPLNFKMSPQACFTNQGILIRLTR